MLEKLITFIPSKEQEVMANYDVLFGKTSVTGGIPATANNATNFATVYACINVLGDDIAKLPWKSFKRLKGNPVRDHESHVAQVLHLRPNTFMTPYTYKKLIVTDVCIHGNHYSYIATNRDGFVEELIPLDPSATRIIIDKKTRKYAYRTTFKDNVFDFLPDQIFHIKSLSTDGVVGVSPLTALRQQMETMDIATKYNKEMVERGATPQGILEVEGQLNADSKAKVREEWANLNSNHQIAITDLGLKYKPIGLTQQDMQFLDMMKFSQQQIASIFKVPMHKLNELSNATYSNIEQQSLDYVKNTIQPWVTQLEEEANFKLFTDQERSLGYYTKFNMDSELRGDNKSRAEVQKIQLWNGAKTINEIRAMNEDPTFEFDTANEPWLSLNVVPAKRAEMYQQNHFGMKASGMTEDDEQENSKGGDEDKEGSKVSDQSD